MTSIERWRGWALETMRERNLEAAAHVATLADAVRTVRSTTASGSAPVELHAGATSPESAPAAGRNADRGRGGIIAELGRALRAGETSAESLLESTLARIAIDNPRTNAFITVTADRARAQAREADAELRRGIDRGPLHGMPVSLKDLIDLAGVPTTAASRVLEGHCPRHHAPVVTRLLEAGAVVVGKTNLHEFAFGTTCEDSAYGPVRHPLDAARSPGGSSGGSAVAVFADLGVASLGTDTGGSIRIPAAACGIVGLKPTWGEVPAAGVVPLARSLDHVGPMARSVDDVAEVFAALVPAGEKAHAPSRVPPRPLTVEGLRLAELGGYFTEVLDPIVRSAHGAALAALRHAGATLVPREVAGVESTAAVYLLTVFAEAAAVHGEWLDLQPGDYTAPVRLRLEVARLVLGEDYVRAQALRAGLADAVERALDGCDALVLPTLPIVAPVLGASTVSIGSRDYPVRALTLRLTQLFDLTGHPAMSLPLWPAGSALPAGLQLVGRRGATWALVDVARRIEQEIRASADPEIRGSGIG